MKFTMKLSDSLPHLGTGEIGVLDIGTVKLIYNKTLYIFPKCMSHFV